MEQRNEEVIIFDESDYYGGAGEDMAISDLKVRDGLTEEEVRENYTDAQIKPHADR